MKHSFNILLIILLSAQSLQAQTENLSLIHI